MGTPTRLPERKLIGGRMRRVKDDEFKHPLGEPFDLAARSIMEYKAKEFFPAPRFPDTTGRKEIINLAKIPSRLPDCKEEEDPAMKELLKLRRDCIDVSLKLNKVIAARDRRFERKDIHDLRPKRGPHMSKYLSDMYTSTSHTALVDHSKRADMGMRKADPAGVLARRHQRHNTDVTGWCSNVLNHFWIYEVPKSKSGSGPSSN